MTNKKEAAVEPIDLASLDTGAASDKGARIELTHPTSEKPLGIYITVLGKHGYVYQEHLKDAINDRQRKAAAAARRGKNPDIRTAEEIEKDGLDLLVLCTVSWETEIKDKNGNVIETKPTIPFGGKELEFNTTNVYTVYKQSIWIRNQVDDAIGDLENFIQA
jgi:hypothetical protein